MDPRNSVIKKRLDDVKRVISVASGKGGVGKSLVASSLALGLSKKGYKVGLLDLDMYGPSCHLILGLEKHGFPEEEKGVIPPKVEGIKFMTIFNYTQDKPAPFRGEDITNVIIELLAITLWGKLDYLIIDMPPGIGEETLDIIRFIKKNEFIVVTTSSKLSMSAVGKLLVILKELNMPIIGVIENMKISGSGFIKNSVSKMKIKHLGNISFDNNLEECIGKPSKLQKTIFMEDLQNIIDKIV